MIRAWGLPAYRRGDRGESGGAAARAKAKAHPAPKAKPSTKKTTTASVQPKAQAHTEQAPARYAYRIKTEAGREIIAVGLDAVDALRVAVDQGLKDPVGLELVAEAL